MSRQPEYIGIKGGDVIGQFLFDSATNTLVTASLVSGTNYMDLGHLESSVVSLTPTVTKYKSEDGVDRKTTTVWEGTITANAQQSSKEIADWVGYTSRNMTLIIYKNNGRKNGKYQEFWAIGENENGFTFSSPDSGSGTPVKINIVPRTTAVTLTTTQIAAMRTALAITQGGVTRSVSYPYYASNLTITADQEFIITETTG